ncbi:DUF4197 domain-containing protein [Uliginosibacterium sp. sgz301328]|uniref:DUF4197 domain-containing protein n=1 Tax=Uliginosibacterium sp. sgz301328 TaxID=3243764 RepID=UPI00359DC449
MKRLNILPLLFVPTVALAGLLDAISSTDATAGLRDTLLQGASTAVSTLGAKDGFLANPSVKIPLPSALKRAEPMLRAMGKGPELDELSVAINRAAESAVAEAKPLLTDAVKQMTVQDAKGILTGGDDSVTQYFRGKTMQPLTQKFLPVVSKATARVGLAAKYNQLAGQGAALGLIKQEDASVEQYVTRSALDALYKSIAEQERAIRANPAQAATNAARKVFDAMR